MTEPEEVEEIEKMVASLNPSVKVHKVLNGELDPSILAEIGPYNSGEVRDPKKINAWLATESSKLGVASSIQPVKVSKTGLGAVKKPAISVHSNVATFSITVDRPIDPDSLMDALETIQDHYGDSLLRMKGILHLTSDERPIVVHGVYGQIYPLTWLNQWPEDKVESKIVFIVRALVRDQIEQLFRSIALGEE